MGNQSSASKAAHYPAGTEDGATSPMPLSPNLNFADDMSPTTVWRWDSTSKDPSDPMSPTTKCIKQKLKDPAVMTYEDGASEGTASADPMSPTTMWRWETTARETMMSDPMSPTTKCIKQKMMDPSVSGNSLAHWGVNSSVNSSVIAAC